MKHTWLGSSALLYSLCCYSKLIGATYTVTSAIDMGSTSDPGSLSTAIYQANQAGGGDIVFSVPQVTLQFNLYPIGYNVPSPGTYTFNTNMGASTVTINGASSYTGFSVIGGNVTFSDMIIENCFALGGDGGSNGTGGGGGLGAGAALFVNNVAAVSIGNIAFKDNQAQGGTGGIGNTDFSNDGAAGGGGGGFNGGNGGNGGSGVQGWSYINAGAGGGGGGGGGLFATSDGQNGQNGTPNNNGQRGLGGIPGGGAGGEQPSSASGGDGSDFGGGGGGAGAAAQTNPRGDPGGLGGWGGGGGGGGNGVGSFYIASLGSGGLSTFGGGAGGNTSQGQFLISPGSQGANGQGLGGAIFVRNGGTLGITQPCTFSGNTAPDGGTNSYIDAGVLLILDAPVTWNSSFSKIDPNAELSLSGGTFLVDETAQFTFPVITNGGSLSAQSGKRGTFTGDISGSGLSIGQSPPAGYTGTIILANTSPNSWSGALDINEGTLRFDTNCWTTEASISSLNFNGGSLAVNSNLSISSPLTLTDSAAIQVLPNYVLTLSESISGSATLTFDGAGTATISSIGNTYSGGTTFRAGSVIASNPTSLGSGAFTFSGGSLQIANGSSLSQNLVVTPNTDSSLFAVLQVNGSLSGGGSLRLLEDSNLVFAGTNTGFTGSLHIGQNANAQFNTTVPGVGSSLIFDQSSSNLTFSSVATAIPSSIFGPGDVIITGSSNCNFTGDNTYSGSTNIALGSTLTIAFSTSFPSGGNIINSGSVIFAHPAGTIVPGNIIGGQVSVTGGSILELNSEADFQTDFNLFNGTLSLQGAVIDGSITISGTPSALQIGGSASLSGSFTLNANSMISLTDNASFLLSGLVSGAGNLTVLGPRSSSVIIPNSPNSNSGALTLTDCQILLSDPSSLGTGTINLNGPFISINQTTNPWSQNTVLGSNTNTTFSLNTSTPLSFSGSISGGGGLELAQGTFYFSGTNTYAGTTTINAGVQAQYQTYSAIALGNLFVNNGTLVFNGIGGGPNDVSSPISGTGPIVVQNSSNVIFSGVNTFTGLLTIESGSSLAIPHTASYPSLGSMTINGSAAFGQAGLISLGALSGNGSLFLNGGGTLNFTASSPNLSVPLTINNGKIIVTGSQQLGTSSIIFNTSSGALNQIELNATQASIFDLPITLEGTAVASLFVNENSADWTWNNSLIQTSGNADLFIGAFGNLTWSRGSQETVLGQFNDNTLTILNPNTDKILSITGTINDTHLENFGNIVVNGVQLKKTLGSIEATGNLVNHGSLYVGRSSSLSLDSDFTQTPEGSTTFQVHSTGNGKISTSGMIDVEGSGVAKIVSGVYVKGMRMTLVEGGTSLNGEMNFSYIDANTEASLPSGYFRAVHSANPHIYLDVLNNIVLYGAQVSQHNPQEVLHYLQQASYAIGGDLFNVVNEISLLSSEQMTKALDQLHPAQFGAFDLLNMNMNSLIVSILSSEIKGCCPEIAADCGCSLTLWAQPYGYFTSQDKIGDQLGFTASAAGFVSGLQFCLPHNLELGIAGGYGSNSLNWDESRGHGSLNSAYLALYTNWSQGVGFLQASLLGSWDGIAASRHIHFEDINRHAKHNQNGFNTALHLGGGANLSAVNVEWTPFGNLDYLYLNQIGFTEKGADSLNLVVKARGSHMLRSEIGLRVSHPFNIGKNSCFTPTVWASGINECYLDSKSYEAKLKGQENTFTVRTFYKPIYLFSPGVELSFLIDSSLGLSARYSAEINGQIANQKLDGRVSWKF